ncbi:MAG: hypothetical protein JSW11_17470 [Candidatus Heimdallarchaeota archaeon]|nr:MAG: hypothetical protein JSW11_17470 [Candidatus Heimdallarchaeota archaeon]
MNTDQRRLYLNNWAILTTENEVKWHFGDIDKEKLDQTVDFVKSVSRLGAELWGQGIGVVRLRYPRPHPSQAREIMIVNLSSKMKSFNIVISDPLVTTRLMSRIEVETAPWDEMRSILAGGASVIYSQFYSQEGALDSSVVDALFQEAVNAVTYNEYVTVGNGECSFSALSFEELLFFHALLRELFESYYSTMIPSNPWGVIHSTNGVPVHLQYNPPLDAALISAFSAVIVNYCQLLFEAYPARLVFGAHSMQGMDFISTEENVFVVNNPRKLLGLQKFQREWKKTQKITPEVIHDLAPAMKEYFIDLSIQGQREKLKNLEFHRVINYFTRMGIRRARAYRLPK